MLVIGFDEGFVGILYDVLVVDVDLVVGGYLVVYC